MLFTANSPGVPKVWPACRSARSAQGMDMCEQSIIRRNSVDVDLYAGSINLESMIEIVHNSQVKS